jgi:hypothetical protein
MHITAMQLLLLEKARQELEKLAAHEDQGAATARALASALGSFLEGPKSTGIAGRPSQTLQTEEPDDDASETVGPHGEQHVRPSLGRHTDASPARALRATPESGELVDSALTDVVDSLSTVAACLAALEFDPEPRKAA